MSRRPLANSDAIGPPPSLASPLGRLYARVEMTPLERRIERAVREDVAIVPYDSRWPQLFRREAEHLRSCLPAGLIGRIEHFGSTAVPGLAAKPIIDLLVEVRSLRAARTEIAPILKAQGYDYFWRPSFGSNVPPWYAFFIRRNRHGTRTHHIHMITRRRVFREHWDRLLFRDYLIAHPETAREYARLKTALAALHSGDRVAYTAGKTAFIQRVTAAAKAWIKSSGNRIRGPI
ncbi:MAG TPA: GrpB family protein [Candidatus Acidoferrum sp.]|nr:GrpB family protein [Candidatus Acidoferrum sp.]